MARSKSSSSQKKRSKRSSSSSSKGRTKRSSSSPPPPTWDERLIQYLIPRRWEVSGVLLFALGFITLLSLIGLTSSGILGWWTNLWRQLFGWGAYPLTVTVMAVGVHIGLHHVEKPYQVKPSQVIGVEMLLLAALPISHALLGATLNDVYLGYGGGLIGWALSEPLLDFLGPILTLLTYAILLGWGVALIAQVTWQDMINWLKQSSTQLQTWSDELEEDVREREKELAERRPLSPPPPERPPIINLNQPQADELIIIDDSAVELAPQNQQRNRYLPTFNLLEEGVAFSLSPEEIDEKKQTIEQTLQDFGLPALVTEIRRGPAITQFGVQPGYIERTGPDGQPKYYKVRVGQIASLQKDLALALAAPRLRIEAPVPGRGIVGVEVPNAQTSIVRLKTILESDPFYHIKSPLAVALGRDVAGAPVVSDLAKLPHLLIAGTTGSGKSVCLNALVTCLVFNNTPDKLKLVMIDPKKVELIRFNGLPHLLGKVEVEAERVIGVLQWLTAEMDQRYEAFTQVGAKHLADYNRKIARHETAKPMPYIAVFIDELADLMGTYPADVERTLCRLAQMARATGIHLVVATQRPSTDVITGLIKANFPARASFSVASGTDSRVILDSVGAEQLLGKGDMLFLGPDASVPQRIQGCFVSDREIENVVRHWEKQTTSGEDAPWETIIARQALIEEKDDMLEQAVALAQKHERLSTSLIQRKLRVGFPRAARLMEALYDLDIVEDPKKGGKTRRTLVDEDDTPIDDYLEEND